MQFKILLLLMLPIYLYSYDYYDYLRDKNIINNQKILLEHKRKTQELEEEKERLRRYTVEQKNREAKLANERYYRSLKSESSGNNRNYGESHSVKIKYNEKDFKNKAQLKLGELHIFGITSVKPFKKNKYIIKAANGTFALPKNKFAEAQKINFNSELLEEVQ